MIQYIKSLWLRMVAVLINILLSAYCLGCAYKVAQHPNGEAWAVLILMALSLVALSIMMYHIMQLSRGKEL